MISVNFGKGNTLKQNFCLEKYIENIKFQCKTVTYRNDVIKMSCKYIFTKAMNHNTSDAYTD